MLDIAGNTYQVKQLLQALLLSILLPTLTRGLVAVELRVQHVAHTHRKSNVKQGIVTDDVRGLLFSRVGVAIQYLVHVEEIIQLLILVTTNQTSEAVSAHLVTGMAQAVKETMEHRIPVQTNTMNHLVMVLGVLLT